MTEPIEAITRLNAALDGVPFSYAFLGGSVLSLLVTDKSVDAIRVMGLGTSPPPTLLMDRIFRRRQWSGGWSLA